MPYGAAPTSWICRAGRSGPWRPTCPASGWAGVALREDEVEVSIVVRMGRPLPEIADGVRAAVAPMVGDRPVNVHIGGLR
ncbi:hypothetical protein GCM10018952_66360 [Streptosporangium vulgare]